MRFAKVKFFPDSMHTNLSREAVYFIIAAPSSRISAKYSEHTKPSDFGYFIAMELKTPCHSGLSGRSYF
jgi:hypothetical protein